MASQAPQGTHSTSGSVVSESESMDFPLSPSSSSSNEGYNKNSGNPNHQLIDLNSDYLLPWMPSC